MTKPIISNWKMYISTKLLGGNASFMMINSDYSNFTQTIFKYEIFMISIINSLCTKFVSINKKFTMIVSLLLIQIGLIRGTMIFVWVHGSTDRSRN